MTNFFHISESLTWFDKTGKHSYCMFFCTDRIYRSFIELAAHMVVRHMVNAEQYEIMVLWRYDHAFFNFLIHTLSEKDLQAYETELRIEFALAKEGGLDISSFLHHFEKISNPDDFEEAKMTSI